MKKILYSFLTLGIVSSIASCSSDVLSYNTVVNDTKTVNYLPATIISSTAEYKSVKEYAFDGQNRLTSITETYSPLDSDGNPLESEINTCQFDYKGGKLNFVKIDVEGEGNTFFIKYGNDNTVSVESKGVTKVLKLDGNKIKGEIVGINEIPSNLGGTEYAFWYDSSNNILKTEILATEDTQNYEYDLNKKGIFVYCTTPLWVFQFLKDYNYDNEDEERGFVGLQYFMPNLLDRKIDYDDALDFAIKFNWTFDNLGNPVKVLLKNRNDEVIEREIKYLPAK